MWFIIRCLGHSFNIPSDTRCMTHYLLYVNLNLTLIPMPIIMRIITLEQAARITYPGRASYLNNIVRSILDVIASTWYYNIPNTITLNLFTFIIVKRSESTEFPKVIFFELLKFIDFIKILRHNIIERNAPVNIIRLEIFP